MNKLGVTILGAFVLLFSGILIPQFTLLDGSFGLGFYVLDKAGHWASGPSWVLGNRPLAILCALVVPIAISILISVVSVQVFVRIWKHSRYSALLFGAIVFLALYGPQSSPDSRISYSRYVSSNY